MLAATMEDHAHLHQLYCKGKLSPFPLHITDGGHYESPGKVKVYIKLTAHNTKVTSLPFLPTYPITIPLPSANNQWSIKYH